MALSTERNTIRIGEEVVLNQVSGPIAANVKIYKGAQVCVTAAGYIAPATSALGLKVLGRSPRTYDNTSGSAGAFTVNVECGGFKWANSTSTDAITQQHMGLDCYAVDDFTVALTDGAGARSRAGKIIGVDSDGQVMVEQGIVSKDSVPTNVICIPVTLANIPASGGHLVTKYTPGFAGRIRKMSMLVTTAATTAAKLATLQANINPAGGADAASTGGALALTSANMTPAGAVVDSSAVTAGGSFGAGDAISITTSAVTAFVEGAGVLLIALG